ncbi:hypothetical protein NMY22_g12179 [Coprinellus aureogranulatus]|nr:hypothetical protein NMY22_g12179 [Coprinellus aureogranulatus]
MDREGQPPSPGPTSCSSPSSSLPSHIPVSDSDFMLPNNVHQQDWVALDRKRQLIKDRTPPFVFFNKTVRALLIPCKANLCSSRCPSRRGMNGPPLATTAPIMCGFPSAATVEPQQPSTQTLGKFTSRGPSSEADA